MDTIDPVELQYWLVFLGVEPIGEARDDFRTALVCATVGRSVGAKCDVPDFVTDWWRPPNRGTPPNVFKEWLKARAAVRKMKNGG